MTQLRLRLPLLRAKSRLSQRQLAEQAGLRPDTISALERGESTGIRFETLVRLCDVLHCQPGDLFELEAVSHTVPVLGGPDEDDVIRQRLLDPGRRVDGASFVAELLKLSAESRPQRAGSR